MSHWYTRLLLGVLLCSCSLTLLAQPVSGQEKTLVADETAKTKLLGKHRFSVQWISWDRFGSALITEKNGLLSIKGEQRLPNSSDFLTMDGIITKVESRRFTFKGKIVIQCKEIYDTPCVREGEMTFIITGNRKYWRLQQMQTCNDTTDYVDIFF
ncbi:MAG: hypothetical protein K1Y36_19145 [Blastocatellia bacterium]|nr:hypothetical protein [Blastocatellia bacterium]